MTRDTQPTFGLIPKEAEDPNNAARVERLALFVNVARSNTLAAAVLGEFTLSSQVVGELDKPPYNEMAGDQQLFNTLTFDQKMTYAAALILHHKDDEEALSDIETTKAVRKEIAEEPPESTFLDIANRQDRRRFIRIQVIATEIGQYAQGNLIQNIPPTLEELRLPPAEAA
ncbi:MAG TPA: hypothetical protein VLG16_02075 [Candidatus Saccharimonadales bacterium]|nr:hypothetical protein [Candidatus Saccharimonadales bacterium]